ncbi:MAG: hypothetical protein ABSE56_02775, partial [Bryobacteraceae bacterium]
MPRGSLTQTRSFNYDLSTGRLASATNPETGTVSYTYNGDGSLASKTDAKSQQITYNYDSYGRLTQAAGYTYSYDTNPLDPNYSSNAWGRLAAVQWNGGASGLDFAEMYSYTPGGLMTAKRLRAYRYLDPLHTQTVDFEATFASDSEGRYLGPTKYPGAYSPAYSYEQDTLGRPVKMTMGPLNYGDPSLDIVKDVTYGPSGELTQMRTAGTGGTLLETRGYNTLGQLTRITVPGVADLEYR